MCMQSPGVLLKAAFLGLTACTSFFPSCTHAAGGKTVHTVVGVGEPDKNGLTMDILCRMSELRSSPRHEDTQ